MTTDSKLILVGQVAGGFGVKGEVRVTAYTAEPITLLSYGVLLRADGSTGLTLTAGRAEKSAVVGRAKEIATKEQADALRGLAKSLATTKADTAGKARMSEAYKARLADLTAPAEPQAAAS